MTHLLVQTGHPVVSVVDTASHRVRGVHPWAWWCWALCAATAVSQTHNMVLILLVVGAVVVVMELRRSDAPWARAVGLYFALAGTIVVIRVVFWMLLGSARTGQVLFTLPRIPLPSWAQGIQLGGPVTLDGLVFTLSDAMRIAALVICVGMANALANPKRALRAVPAALYEVSTALVIALSSAPQLIESALRVRRARRLRGGRDRGWGAVVGVVVPVLGDAIDRSLRLAAGMEARGYGSTRAHLRAPRTVTALMVVALGALAFGAFCLLGLPWSRFGWWALSCLVMGVTCAAAALRLAGRGRRVTRYRPDPWGAPEWGILAGGLTALGLTLWLVSVQAGAMNPTTTPVTWPTVTAAMLLVPLALLCPLVAVHPVRPGAS